MSMRSPSKAAELIELKLSVRLVLSFRLNIFQNRCPDFLEKLIKPSFYSKSRPNELKFGGKTLDVKKS